MKQILIFICAVLFLLGIAMNLQYAVNDYDFKTNSIHSVILAQDTGTGTGTGGSSSEWTCYASYTSCGAFDEFTGNCGKFDKCHKPCYEVKGKLEKDPGKCIAN